MTFQRIAGVCFWILITSAVAAGQQRADTTDQSSQPANRVVERTFPAGGLTPSRQTQTRIAAGSREVVTETVEMPGFSGKLEPIRQVTTETVRTGNGSRSTQDLYGIGAERQRVLLERTESDHEVSAAGSTRTVATTWTSDPDGRLGLKSRQIEETTSTAANTHESRTTRLLPDINDTISESERTESTERPVGATIVRDSAHLVRDLNGRWQPTETRTRDSRQMGSSEQLEEETILRRDINGQVTVGERSTTRRTRMNGREDVVVETYSPNAEGFVRSDTRLGLSRRIRTSTTATADGGSYSVEETEARSLLVPADPMRVTRRVEVTVRRIGPDRWATERRVFERDVNGRMLPIVTEVEETAGK